MRPIEIIEAIEECSKQRERVGFEEEKLLRTLGWGLKCGHPGGLWLWVKDLDGKHYRVPAEIALQLESSLAHLEVCC